MIASLWPNIFIYCSQRQQLFVEGGRKISDPAKKTKEHYFVLWQENSGRQLFPITSP
jgi:hypothetical protein